ncbi:hypothetical protein N7476_002125 [Penicillium atrosanguineum]|uniref:Uncharacterized protein n=1 Tax=Penicillium atrosanguineum TaxID=1132637 RepID=A0A9W9U7C3_9EURO|nr:hypothetical protein N7526_006036 [Penicillium atrosanguineum]KAJ5323525.1 hypothetical protein N7476_002125 [Penicillium atrosanguineum]
MHIVSTDEDIGEGIRQDTLSQDTLTTRAERVFNRARIETLPIYFTAKEICLLIQHFKKIKNTEKANIHIHNLLAAIIINQKYPEEVAKMFEDMDARKPKGYAARWTNEFHMDNLEREVLEQLEVEKVNGEQGPSWVVPQVPADPSKQRGRFADKLEGGGSAFESSFASGPE